MPRLWLLAALLAGCSHRTEADAALRSEAGLVAHAIHRLREAPRGERRPLVAALQDLPCKDSEVCECKRVCFEAHELAARVDEDLASLRRAAGSTDAPVPGTKDLLEKAEATLGRAHELSQQCVELEGALRRRYSL
jgi:hypothetical protein